MRIVRLRKWLLSLALSTAAGWVTLPDGAGYCATCYAATAASGDKGIRALQLGIIVLMIPTVTILGGILWRAFRSQETVLQPESQLRQEPWEGQRNEVVAFRAVSTSLPALKPH